VELCSEKNEYRNRKQSFCRDVPKGNSEGTFFFPLGIDDHWKSDVMRMSNYAKENGGSSFVLVVMGVYSEWTRERPTH
jgi:hypothetical protein